MRSATAITAGAVVGRLTVVGADDSVRDGRRRWWCACACGSENKSIREDNIIHNGVQSCGCLRLERLRAAVTTHGFTTGSEPRYEYVFWAEMRRNCADPTRNGFAYAGAVGIAVADEWRESFEAFERDIGPRPSAGAVLGRVNKAGGFVPGNVRWMSTRDRQLGKSDMRPVTINGVTRQLIEWADIVGVRKSTMHWRLKNWPENRWLEPPAAQGGPRKHE